MFDDLPPVIESEQERSTRHSRMVRQSAVFVTLLLLFAVVFAGVGMWLVHGRIDVDMLVFLAILLAIAVPIGMYFELRKRW